MEQLLIVGNLGRDPELNVTTDGTPYTKFSVAVSRKNRNTETTTWYNVTSWRGLAEVCERYLQKGSRVLVQGHFQLRKYNDRNGTERMSPDITAEKVEFLGKTRSNDVEPSDGPAPDAFSPLTEEEMATRSGK